MPLRLLIIALIVVLPPVAHGETSHRTLVVREKNAASLLGGGFEFKLLKINGYSIRVRTPRGNKVLKVGQSFSPVGHDCSVIFEEIATETRLAKFSTDCR